jgi:hypothetical protein
LSQEPAAARHSGTEASIIITKETLQVPFAVIPRKNSKIVVNKVEVEKIIPILMKTTAM